jgi:ABC-type transporter Mla subunit MlaD
MRSKWALIAVVVVAGAVAAGVVAAVGIAFGGGGSSGTTSKDAYQQTVVNARDRVDFALARIGKSQSVDELIQRVNDASDTVGSAAAELDATKVASGFENDNAKLVLTLRAFSKELSNTAQTFSDPTFGSTLASLNSLSFPQWDKVNAILGDLHARGIEVAPLARH